MVILKENIDECIQRKIDAINNVNKYPTQNQNTQIQSPSKNLNNQNTKSLQVTQNNQNTSGQINQDNNINSSSQTNANNQINSNNQVNQNEQNFNVPISQDVIEENVDIDSGLNTSNSNNLKISLLSIASIVSLVLVFVY